MKSRNSYELEAMGCVALFVLVILALVARSLYEHGYLGIAVALVGGVALFVGLIGAFLRIRLARRQHQANRRSPRQEEQHHQTPLPREHQQEERPPRYEERFVYSVPQERREEERPIYPLEEEEQPIEELPKRGAIVQRLNEMSDEEFEQVVGCYLRNRGYVVETTLASGGGRGADFIIAAAEYRISVLLKRQDAPLDDRAVQEALGGRAFYGAYEAWLITNDAFTRGALYEAKRKGVRLIDGDELAEWLEKLPE